MSPIISPSKPQPPGAGAQAEWPMTQWPVRPITRRGFVFGKAKQLAEDDNGATAIEYSLLAALASVTLILTFGRVNRRNKRSFRKSKKALKNG